MNNSFFSYFSTQILRVHCEEINPNKLGRLKTIWLRLIGKAPIQEKPYYNVYVDMDVKSDKVKLGYNISFVLGLHHLVFIINSIRLTTDNGLVRVQARLISKIHYPITAGMLGNKFTVIGRNFTDSKI